MPLDMTDLRQRADALDKAGGTTYNVYQKLLKWRELAFEAIEMVAALEEEKNLTCRMLTAGIGALDEANRKIDEQYPELLDCEGIESGGKGKVDIRRFFNRGQRIPGANSGYVEIMKTNGTTQLLTHEEYKRMQEKMRRDNGKPENH